MKFNELVQEILMEDQEVQSNNFEFFFWKIYHSADDGIERTPDDIKKYWTDYFNGPAMKNLNPGRSQDLIDRDVNNAIESSTNPDPTQITAFNHMTFNKLFNDSA